MQKKPQIFDPQKSQKKYAISDYKYNEISKKKFKIQKEKNLIKTYHFERKNKINIIYSEVDFLKIKLEKEKNKNLLNLENELIHINLNQDIYDVEVKNIINKKILFDKFFIVYSGTVFGGQKKLYDLYDFDKNKIGQIVIKVITGKKTNHNVIDSIEFSGLFFKCYKNYLKNFVEYFNINTKKQGLVKRIDFCIDVEGLEVYQILEYIKENYRKTKNIIGLSATDLKILSDNSTNIKHGKQEIYVNFFSAHNDLKIYDKILDILNNYIKRKVNGVNPYQKYLDSDNPIFRIELKKKKFQNLRDNSLDWVLNNIEALFFDYLLKYFEIDFSLFSGKEISLNGKKIFKAKEEKEKSLYNAKIMAQAYLRTIEELEGKNGRNRFLLKLFPELENINSLDLVDDFAVFDFFSGITENIEF